MTPGRLAPANLPSPAAPTAYLPFMPAYDFRCIDCGHEFERRLSMSAYADGEGRECPECESTEVQRAWTAVNVIAGGSGSGGSSASCGPGGFT